MLDDDNYENNAHHQHVIHDNDSINLDDDAINGDTINNSEFALHDDMEADEVDSDKVATIIEAQEEGVLGTVFYLLNQWQRVERNKCGKPSRSMRNHTPIYY